MRLSGGRRGAQGGRLGIKPSRSKAPRSPGIQPRDPCRCHVTAGVRKVAILDFDVHHGNGTEACVGAVAPRMAKYSFQTPVSEGVQMFPTFRPWLDADDADNILFARCVLGF